MTDLVFIFGPAAAGKLTIARELSRLTGLPVFHNHLIVNAVVAVFPFGSEEFVRLRDEFWMATFAAAAANARSLIFTFAPESTVPDDFPGRVEATMAAAGGRVRFVELTVSEAEQEARIGNADRAAAGKLASLTTLRAIRRRDVADATLRTPMRAEVVIDTDRSTVEASARAIRNSLTLTSVPRHQPYPAAGS